MYASFGRSCAFKSCFAAAEIARFDRQSPAAGRANAGRSASGTGYSNVAFRSRRLFKTTLTLLNAMAPLARIGESNQPVAG